MKGQKRSSAVCINLGSLLFHIPDGWLGLSSFNCRVTENWRKEKITPSTIPRRSLCRSTGRNCVRSIFPCCCSGVDNWRCDDEVRISVCSFARLAENFDWDFSGSDESRAPTYPLLTMHFDHLQRCYTNNTVIYHLINLSLTLPVCSITSTLQSTGNQTLPSITDINNAPSQAYSYRSNFRRPCCL